MLLNNSKKGVSPKFAIVFGLVAILILCSFIFLYPSDTIQFSPGEGDPDYIIEITHSPDNPEEGDTVSFVATAYFNDSIKEIEIYVADNLVKTCDFTGVVANPVIPGTRDADDYLYEAGCTFSDTYSSGTFSYYARVYGSENYCLNGACLYEGYKSATCEVDSDGDDPSVIGFISIFFPSQGTVMSKADYCIDGEYLFEYYCFGETGGAIPPIPPIETTFTGGKIYFCNHGCSEGVCRGEEVPIDEDPWSSGGLCIEDSDGGNLPLIFGETTGQQGRLSDSCFIETTLSEYYCDEDRALIEEIYLCDNIWHFSDVETFVVESSGNGGGGSNNGCTENWDCTSWTTCINNQQTRICTDLNDCGTEDYKPELVRICDSGTTQLPEDEEEGGVAWEQIFQDIQSKPVLLFIIVISSIVVVGIISIIIINRKKKSIVGNLGGNVSEQN